MKSLAVLYVVVSLWFTQATAVTWYYLRYWTPADDISFTNFSMKMVIPSLPQAATYYLWPGLQDVNTTGVFQPVLDGRSGTWWISPGWCCSYTTPNHLISPLISHRPSLTHTDYHSLQKPRSSLGFRL